MAAHLETPVTTPRRTISSVPEPDLAIGMRYVARQPILDLHGKVHGYELLFREGPRAILAETATWPPAP